MGVVKTKTLVTNCSSIRSGLYFLQKKGQYAGVCHPMKIRLILIVLLGFTLTGCGHYNYAVKHDGSPIPYKNQYDGDDNEEYEFYRALLI